MTASCTTVLLFNQNVYLLQTQHGESVDRLTVCKL